MSDITSIKHSELDVMLRASVYLRDKLLRNGRNGPLVKLLSREIDVFNDEMDRRLQENPSLQASNSSKAPTGMLSTPPPQKPATEKATAPLHRPTSAPQNGMRPITGALNGQVKPTPSQTSSKPEVSSAPQSSLLKRVQTDK